MTIEPAAYLSNNDEKNAPTNEGKLIGLQILRFVAAFAVVLFHIGSGYQVHFENHINIFSFGAAGVDVFFVLSGFIIAMTTKPARGAWYFCRRRLVRVAPLYWILTFGIALIGIMLPSLLNSTVVTLEYFLKSLFFIPYERPDGAVQPLLFLGWTLNYEMFFYAIYAACLLAGWRSPLAPVAVVVFLVAAGQIISFDNVMWRFYSNPIIIEFAIGVGIYFLYLNNQVWLKGKAAILASAALFFYISFFLFPSAPWLLASALPAALLVVAFISFTPKNSRWIGFLVLLGNASYSLYLSHPYIIQIFSKFAPAESPVLFQIILGTISAISCIIFSIAIYKTIEIPLQRYIKPSSK